MKLLLHFCSSSDPVDTSSSCRTVVMSSTEDGSPEPTNDAHQEAPGASKEQSHAEQVQEAALRFADLLVKGVLCELFGEGAEAALQGHDHVAAIHTAAAAAGGQVVKGKQKAAKAKRAPRPFKPNNFTLFRTLATTHTGVGALNALGACWSQMEPTLKADLEQRLTAVKEVVTGLMAAGDTVHVAELLAQHEAQQQLEPFPWTDTLAPYRDMPNNSGRKRKEAPAAAATAEADDTPAQQQGAAEKANKQQLPTTGTAAAVAKSGKKAQQAPAAGAAASDPGQQPSAKKKHKKKHHTEQQQE